MVDAGALHDHVTAGGHAGRRSYGAEYLGAIDSRLGMGSGHDDLHDLRAKIWEIQALAKCLGYDGSGIYDHDAHLCGFNSGNRLRADLGSSELWLTI